MNVEADLAIGKRVKVRYMPGDPSRMDIPGSAELGIRFTFGAAAVLWAIGGGIILGSAPAWSIRSCCSDCAFTVHRRGVPVWARWAFKRSDARQLGRDDARAGHDPVDSPRHEGFGTPTVTYQGLDGDFVTRRDRLHRQP